MTQSVKGARQALLTACQGPIYGSKVDSTGEAVLVSLGYPGSYQPQNIVAVGIATAGDVTRPTMGTSRSRDKALQITVTISVFRAGDQTQEQPAIEDCDDLIDLLESYFRTSPNDRLGGACYDAWVSAVDGPNLTPSVHPKSGAVTGYVAEAVTTVSMNIRY